MVINKGKRIMNLINRIVLQGSDMSKLTGLVKMGDYSSFRKHLPSMTEQEKIEAFNALNCMCQEELDKSLTVFLGEMNEAIYY